ncbi:MAG: DUF4062 domain-containing protein [Planctomycetota bacterium]|jgi:hypothetical protein
MARFETILSVFVASPADVADARKRLERVVDELNYTWSRQYRLRLELLRWETHAYSDVGTDAQEVINRRLDEFDIFLGIMWKRFGQPTGRAESGTQEEFMRAMQRFREDPSRVRIMFYFNDAAPGRLSQIDTAQLEAVNQFRSEVARSGVLYWKYQTTSEFEASVRRHLSRQIQEWGKTWGGVVDEHEREPPSLTVIAFEEMGRVEPLHQRTTHDPAVVHHSFLEAQVILDSSPHADEWGRLAAQHATALVAVASAHRLAASKTAEVYIARVCDRIMSLRGLRVDWGEGGQETFYKLLLDAKDRHDDDVLLWIKNHTSELPDVS